MCSSTPSRPSLEGSSHSLLCSAESGRMARCQCLQRCVNQILILRVDVDLCSVSSRMTETVLPADLVAALDPKYVAPVVAYLCHESSTTNGGLFESGAGYCAQVHFQRSAGVHVPLHGANAQAFTPEVIAASWGAINDFSRGATYPQGINDSMSEIMSGLGADVSAGGSNLGKGNPNNKPQLSAQGANGAVPAAAATAAASSSSSAAVAFKSDPVFAELSSVITSDPSVTKLNGIFVYNLSSGPGGASKSVTVSLKKDGGASLYEGPPRDGKKADVTIDVADADYCDLAAGKASAQMRYMKGKLKMKGSHNNSSEHALTHIAAHSSSHIGHPRPLSHTRTLTRPHSPLSVHEQRTLAARSSRTSESPYRG